MSELNVLWQLAVLTAAHVGFLHSPNVGATQVTGLHNADLVGAEAVIQRATELLRRRTNGYSHVEKQTLNTNEGRGVQLTHLSFFFLFFVILVSWINSELGTRGRSS